MSSISRLHREQITLLITIRQLDINSELSVVHRQLRSALLQMPQNQVVTLSRFGNGNVLLK